MIKFSEYDDRFESIILVDNDEVTVSIDKPISETELSKMGVQAEQASHQLLFESVKYIERLKSDRGIDYIDDLSDPQIMMSEDIFSVYWYSEKGERNGESVLGVDFTMDTLEPVDLAIGD